jgi:hypothetical protein
MAHDIGVFVPLAAGGWRGLFPDVPGCEATGPSLDLAVSHAASALAHRAGESNGNHRAPRDLTAVRNDAGWASDNAIDWSAAVVTMIRTPG